MGNQRHSAQNTYYYSSRKETICLNDAKYLHLVTLYDELRSLLEHDMQSLVYDVNEPELFRDEIQRWNDSVLQLRNAARELRFVPVKMLFFRFRKIVADLAKLCGMPIVLCIEGEDVEVDKYVLDELGEIFLWWIRNAVDYGFDGPNAGSRYQQEKLRKGTLTLKAYHHGEHVIIEMADDGKGLDLERLHLQTDKDGYLDREALRKCSHRFPGLDSVFYCLNRLGIEMTVQTALYKGTMFTMKLPYEFPEKPLRALPVTSVL